MKGIETREQAFDNTMAALKKLVERRLPELPDRGECIDIELKIVDFIREESSHVVQGIVGP